MPLVFLLVQMATSWSTDSPEYAERSGLQSVASLASAWSALSRHLDLEGTDGSPSADLAESLIISALKLALASLAEGGHRPPAWGQSQPQRQRPDRREPMARAVDLGAALADLSAAGVPLDAEAIAAGIVLEAVECGGLGIDAVRARLGPGVAALVHDTLRIRTAPERVELYDDVASRWVEGIASKCMSVTRLSFLAAIPVPVLPADQ